MISRIKLTLLNRPMVSAALIASLLAAVYWLAIASDRFVSESHVIIQRTDLPGGQSVDFVSLLGGASGSRSDQLLLRDYLRSVDMLQKLDATLQLRAHYSATSHDPLSRMWSPDLSMEWFHRYYLSRVSVELDEFAGVLVIKAQGFDSKTAPAVTTLLGEEGERFTTGMAHRLAQGQVLF
jgi:capsular polysaccharide transport system permease protein